MGIDQHLRLLILAHPDASDSQLTIMLNGRHGTKSGSHSSNYNLVQVKWQSQEPQRT
jgi:hypothetical protein